LILEKCPQAEIISIKILDSKLKSRFILLEEALYIAKQQNVDIINLSLGLTKEENITQIQPILMELHNQGVLIVSAYSNTKESSYPASFPFVFGVKGGCYRNKWHYSINTHNMDIKALASPQKVLMQNGFSYAEGNSYAAGNFTGILAKTLLTCKSKEELLEKLKKNSREEDKAENQDTKALNSRAIYFPLEEENIRAIKHKIDNNVDVVGFLDFRSFYNNYYEVKTDKTVKKIKIFGDIVEALWNCDVLIIGNVNFIPKDKLENILKEILEAAKSQNKKVISLESLEVDGFYIPSKFF
jgi:hypothetical protein